MRPRAFLALLGLFALGLVAAGCFEQKSTGKTITQDITVQVGTSVTVVNPEAAGTSSSGASQTTGSTETGTTQTGTTGTTGETGTTGTSSGGTDTAQFAQGKQLFQAKCGGCHTLKDAGTNGTVGPNLDQLKPDAARVEHQILNGGPGMPPKLYTGNDAKIVAAYVSGVAGKS
jgi:mono/diheme cytochrome c family protein